MSDVVNLNSVFKVKNPATGSWEQIPAVKGTSVYTLEALPTSQLVDGKTQTGYILRVFDEKKQLTNPSYECDSFIVWNGIDGDGTVNTIDGIGHDSGSLNVTLKAVRYAQLSEEEKLTSAEQNQARINIDAFKDVPVTSQQNGYIVKYSYDSATESGFWSAASLDVGEIANAVPETRTVNNYSLSADISLNPNDIGAIHSSLTINDVSVNNPTTASASIKLTPANIGALNSSFKINGFSVVNAVSSNAAITLAPASIGAMHSALKINGETVNDPTTDQASIITRIITSNASVSSSAWSSGSTPSSYIDAGYPYQATITVQGVNVNMVPQVNFNLDDSMSGIFAPIAATVSNGVQIYASDVPENDITIPTIICFK